MKIIIANDYEDMSRKAANYLSAQVIMKPDAVLGLATGETPIGTYKQLVEWYNKGDIDFSQTSTINLDEYKGLTGDHKQSYQKRTQEHRNSIVWYNHLQQPSSMQSTFPWRFAVSNNG